MKRVLFIVGPTASGKSSLAMDVARDLNGEIVAADSQTVRRRLNIGTAKPTSNDTAEIPHYMLDIIEPYDRYSVAQFQEAARKHIESIQAKGKLPIVVGGTGLYVDSLFYDYALDDSDAERRKELEQKTVEELQKIIIDKKYPMPENKQNPRHLVGIIARAGVVNDNKDPVEGSCIVGIDRDDADLKQRIHDRVDSMLEDGLLDEVQGMLDDFGQPPEKLDAIAYPIFSKYLNGELTLDQAKHKFEQADWQYVRRQRAWFKRNEHIHWLGSKNDRLTEVKHLLNAD